MNYWLEKGGKSPVHENPKCFPKRAEWLANELFRITNIQQKARQVGS